jgi:hypothetical protein
MVGDVHQPLHASARVTKTQPRGDQGGNLVLVSGPSKELHAYWDTMLGLGDTQNFETAVKVGSALPKPEESHAQDANEADWADESFKLAKSSVYIAPIGEASGPYTPTASYAAQAKQIAQQRVALAGTRLAELLKTALKCGDQSCAH